MFATLNERLSGVFKNLNREAKLTEKNVKEAIREVKLSLLEADVNFKVVKKFIANIEDKALGSTVHKGLSPDQVFKKIVNDEIINILSDNASKQNDIVPKDDDTSDISNINSKSNNSLELKLKKGEPTVIMVCGLQGSGKTTFCSKIAKLYTKQNKKVMLAACDVYRPAAIEQLQTMGERALAEVFTESSNNPISIAKNSLKKAKKLDIDVLIIDTAGRLHVDEEMMAEILNIKKKIAPDYTLFIADAMSGQDSVNVVEAFNNTLDIDGVVLTKMDGDAKGGAALSIRYITDIPITFISTGENIEDLEYFYPDRIADRILGAGDIVSLVEKVSSEINQDELEDMSSRIATSGMNFEDMLSQFKMMKKIGGLGSIMKLLPKGKSLGNMDVDNNRIKQTEAIILSMTKKERIYYKIINSSRKKRIAKGSGTRIADVNRLLKQLTDMNKIVKNINKNKNLNLKGNKHNLSQMLKTSDLNLNNQIRGKYGN